MFKILLSPFKIFLPLLRGLKEQLRSMMGEVLFEIFWESISLCLSESERLFYKKDSF